MTVKDKRREVRNSSADDELLVEAAGLLGVSVSEFLLDRARVDAAAIVESHRSIVLAEAAFDTFLQALDAPVRPPQALVEQARKARRLGRAE
jgi:uncharacterized protein (DUF1778 family)